MLLLVSDLSFGIYLVHIAVMRYFLWKIEWIENNIQDLIKDDLVEKVEE